MNTQAAPTKIFSIPERPDRVGRGEHKKVSLPTLLVNTAEPLMAGKKERKWIFWWRVIAYGLIAEAKRQGLATPQE